MTNYNPQLGARSIPVGLVKDVVDEFGQASDTVTPPGVTDESQPLGLLPTGSQQLHWVVNIGGMRDVIQSVYIGGIQIPVYVVLFGIAGGYLRYLYEIARLKRALWLYGFEL